MREKKNIDRLFQEKFKDFEVHPGDHLWEKIASKKEEKQDRKIIPFWLRLGGIAATLALLIALGSTFFNSNSSSEKVVDTENTFPSEDSDTLTSNEESLTPTTTNDIQNTNDSNSTIATSNNTEKSSSSRETTNKAPEQQQITQNKNSQFKNNNALKSSIVEIQNTSADSNGSQNATRPLNTTTIVTPTQNTPEKTAVAASENNLEKRETSNNFQEPKNLGTVNTSEKGIAENEIATDVNAQKTQDNQKDLVEEAKAIQAAREEEAIASVDINENNNKRWDIGAVAAPVYYGDFGGSGIDPEFKDNKKSGDVNLSYGVQVSYALNNKFKVRTGVSNVDLSYGTEDIAFSPDIEARQLRGVNYTQNARFLSISDNNTQTNALSENSSDVQGGGRSVTPGSINQQVAYIEIPVEAVYVLSDNRFGVELIGGVSTLILNDDNISLESSGGLRTTLGNSNSLNEVSLTTNIGVGLNYKITDNVKVNMEPSFKYQVNAFDSSVGDFKPYYLGLYTGVSYRF